MSPESAPSTGGSTTAADDLDAGRVRRSPARSGHGRRAVQAHGVDEYVQLHAAVICALAPAAAARASPHAARGRRDRAGPRRRAALPGGRSRPRPRPRPRRAAPRAEAQALNAAAARACCARRNGRDAPARLVVMPSRSARRSERARRGCRPSSPRRGSPAGQEHGDRREDALGPARLAAPGPSPARSS